MNNFIGVFDNVLNKSKCQEFIDYFQTMKSMNLVYNRQELKDGSPHSKSDETAFILENQTIPVGKKNPLMSGFLEKFWDNYKLYVDQFSILADSEIHGIVSARLQKTLPGQGYHRWHFESSDTSTSTRIVAWALFLNDIEDGGETEFLYLSQRIKPKQGRLMIWPAAFTHTHRGNPPLSGEKYLLTGWLEYMGKV